MNKKNKKNLDKIAEIREKGLKLICPLRSKKTETEAFMVETSPRGGFFEPLSEEGEKK